MFVRNVLCNDDSHFLVQCWKWRYSHKSWGIEANYKYMQNAKPKNTVLSLLCCFFHTSCFPKNHWCHEQTILDLKSLCRMYLIFLNFPFFMAQFRNYCCQSGSIKCYVVIEWTESVVLLVTSNAMQQRIWSAAHVHSSYSMSCELYGIRSILSAHFGSSFGVLWRCTAAEIELKYPLNRVL